MRGVQSPCSAPGCAALTAGGPCPQHARQREQYRGNASERGYTWRWRQYAIRFLSAHPLCANPYRAHGDELATDVDHIEPHRGDPEKFWNRANHQPLCKACHTRKTKAGE